MRVAIEVFVLFVVPLPKKRYSSFQVLSKIGSIPLKMLAIDQPTAYMSSG